MSTLRPVSGTTREVVELLRAWLEAKGEPEPIVIETSGSTGAAKRVLLSRGAVVASASASRERLGAAGPWVLALPVSYVAGVQVVVRSLLAGHEPVLLEEHASLAAALADPSLVDTPTPADPSLVDTPTPADPSSISDGWADRARFISLVPTQLHRSLSAPSDVEALRQFHTVLLGGGPIDPSLRARAEEQGIHVVATYGSSETAGGCVYDGYPLDGVALEIADDDRIRIGGPVLFDGYADDSALTAACLQDGWFLTSDIGRLHADGRLEVLGRVDDVVISGGVNVPTPAVARRLREHPGVEQAEVIGVPDAEWGHRVVAFVVGRIGRDEARDWVAAQLPRSWAPYEIFLTEEFPLLSNGKVDRQRLRGLFGEA
jgi:O-succinylbenzoic acid--CoA ligase